MLPAISPGTLRGRPWRAYYEFDSPHRAGITPIMTAPAVTNNHKNNDINPYCDQNNNQRDLVAWRWS